MCPRVTATHASTGTRPVRRSFRTKAWTKASSLPRGRVLAAPHQSRTGPASTPLPRALRRTQRQSTQQSSRACHSARQPRPARQRRAKGASQGWNMFAKPARVQAATGTATTPRSWTANAAADATPTALGRAKARKAKLKAKAKPKEPKVCRLSGKKARALASPFAHLWAPILTSDLRRLRLFPPARAGQPPRRHHRGPGRGQGSDDRRAPSRAFGQILPKNTHRLAALACAGRGQPLTGRFFLCHRTTFPETPRAGQGAV